MKVILKISIFTVLVLIFQNCDEIVIDEKDNSVHIVNSNTHGFNIIELKYSALVDASYKNEIQLEDVALSIDLDKQLITHNDLKTSCELDQQRLDALLQIYKDKRICEPAPPPPGTMVCLAIGINDISLFTSQTNEYNDLYPLVCGNGRYLCEKHDEFKALLLDLYNNPPEGCI